MQVTEALAKTTVSPPVTTAPISSPDHKQLPEKSSTFVKNFQGHCLRDRYSSTIIFMRQRR
ncbi:MAG: hypothetical protein WCP16_26570 [Pseudanabaena sp. ELA645]|jgi:hypothetical protein